MKQLLSVLIVFLLVMAAPTAFALDTSAHVTINNSGDPCQNPNVAKSTAIVSAPTASTSQVIALSAGKSIYICDVSTGITGTTANATSFQLVSGTTTTTPCDTGQANVSGAYTVNSVAAGGYFHSGFGGTLYKTAAGKALCSTNTGTNSATVGSITYIQQ